MEKRALNPPPVFLTSSRGRGDTGLIPPSHFEARRQRPAPPLSSPVPPSTEAELLTELTKLKEENEVLKKRQEKEGARARSLDRYLPDVPPSESKALEIIAHQMREIQKLEKLVAVAQQKEEERLRLAQEMEALKRACREAEQEEERRRQEEERKRQAKEAAEIEKLQKLQLLTESHKMESDKLKIRVHALESQLREEREEKILEVKHLREELQVTTEKREALEADFSRSHSELESQKTLVLQLRTYIGELVPDQQVEEQKREKTELKNTIQLLQKERDALQTSMSLLQTRLSSLTHILSLQESDLCKKADKHLGGQKTQQLLKLWREKVFSLMVQLKSEDINRENDSRKIQDKICSLENSLQESSQQLAIYSHAMQDRTAELEMERVRNKCLQDKLTAAQATATSLSSRAEKAEQTVLKLKQMIDSFAQAFYKQENSFRGALQQLVTLGQRVTFATKRVDTIQGLVAQRLALTKLGREEQAGNTATEDDICRLSYEDLMAEVSLLNEERDRLSAELKRSALIIEGRVTQTREKLEAEIEACHHTASLLRSSLHETEERERVLREQVVDLERRLQEACETSTQLQEQLRDQKEDYEKELQDKVRAIEENTTQQMAQMEKHLHEARREHTKAVVALRQTERQIQREKTRSQETTSTIEDAARVREEQLVRQLRDAERDKNLMMATLRQEGLFASYQKTRMSAVQSIEIVNDYVLSPAEDAGARCTPAAKDSISNMVANLQSLGASVLADEEDDDEEDFSH
ncbi:LOW QUALITY PROTEIN: coiled-coil alpha-helical rod protein 1-like [Bufo gargarizans]|uniref:LOW QUALITY PROTEIN: coiled-coil alpha-helical rod protein 1-like n=1 Tax=Bufo gargarizans TaxID=30331 RepID=UPI001CF2F20B|nr:LOW QUALITY PROTEIN: coiled-coil alpha-helical rod protein 1-like [Bufo gargarizans]